MTIKDEILKLFPGSVEMPDPSGAPSADYCIVRPATKADWPENKWVQIGPYVSGDPWEAAWKCQITKVDKWRIPPRPTRENLKQFSSLLTGISFVHYEEFKRYADQVESIIDSQRDHIETTKESWTFADEQQIVDLREEVADGKKQVKSVIEHMPMDCRIYVREGASDENIYASLAVSVAKLTGKLRAVQADLRYGC